MPDPSPSPDTRGAVARRRPPSPGWTTGSAARRPRTTVPNWPDDDGPADDLRQAGGLARGRVGFGEELTATFALFGFADPPRGLAQHGQRAQKALVRPVVPGDR